MEAEEAAVCQTWRRCRVSWYESVGRQADACTEAMKMMGGGGGGGMPGKLISSSLVRSVLTAFVADMSQMMKMMGGGR